MVHLTILFDYCDSSSVFSYHFVNQGALYLVNTLYLETF